MEFKKVQHKDSRQIIKWFVDGKKCSQLEFEYMEQLCLGAGKKYNSSSTYRTNSNSHFIHEHHYN